MKKGTNLVFFLVVGYVLPLLCRLNLILDERVLVLMLAATILVLTQPQPIVSLVQARVDKDTDRFSMIWITMLALPSMIAPIVETAYFKMSPPIVETFEAAPFSSAAVWKLGGLLVIIGGLALRIWAIRTLGNGFTSTVRIMRENGLVTSGPYRFVRHPSYLGAYLAFLGSAVLLQAWIGFVIAAICMGFAYAIRIPIEEKMLESNFGDRWRMYCAGSKRMIPGIW